jgi:hypothetical protein
MMMMILIIKNNIDKIERKRNHDRIKPLFFALRTMGKKI